MTGLGATQPASAAGATRTRTVSHVAQAVFSDADCIVSVSVTESLERLLGSGKPVGAPTATARVDSFCPEGMASATVALGSAEYAFTSESARVNATAGEWNITLTWQANADPHTFVVRAEGTHTVMKDAPVSVTGSVGDIGPENLLMADLATVRTRVRS